MTKKTGSARFHEILGELGDLHDKKQKDYGTPADPFANVRASADFGIPAWVGSMVRANDKMVRIQKAAKGGQLSNEALEDSLRDLAVYAVIGLCLLEEGNQGPAPKTATEAQKELDDFKQLRELAKRVDKVRVLELPPYRPVPMPEYPHRPGLHPSRRFFGGVA